MEKEFVILLRPERGEFSADTVKKWASEVLFIEEGIVIEKLSLRNAVKILHKYNYAKVKM